MDHTASAAVGVMDMIRISSEHEAKYNSLNPLKRVLVGRFLRLVVDTVGALGANSILFAGCGEGHVIKALEPFVPNPSHGLDLRIGFLVEAFRKTGRVDLVVGDVSRLPYGDDRFDLVVCLEVLEHLGNPRTALVELTRVSRRHVLLSVPHEPYFRLGNLMSLRHLRRLGNHPEHVQRWNPGSFCRFVSDVGRPIRLQTAFPWIVVLVDAVGSGETVADDI
jgi:hypothetical protein